MAAGYLMGSLPFGLLAARYEGVDLRKVGSGNIGATNVLRGVGKKAAVLTLLGDALKGSAAVALGTAMGLDGTGRGLVGLAAVLGHDFSVFLRFRGGKGVATSMGVILVLSPYAGLAALGIWILTAIVTRYSSLSAIVSFSALPLAAGLTDPGRPNLLLFATLAALILYKHAGNIRRLLEGKERKIGEKA
jgi:glycerol-3-phosphate acyltransferase PlsY